MSSLCVSSSPQLYSLTLNEELKQCAQKCVLKSKWDNCENDQQCWIWGNLHSVVSMHSEFFTSPTLTSPWAKLTLSTETWRGNGIILRLGRKNLSIFFFGITENKTACTHWHDGLRMSMLIHLHSSRKMLHEWHLNRQHPSHK